MKIWVNGIAENSFGDTATPFGVLLEGIRRRLNSPTEVISSLVLDGNELTEDDEFELGAVPAVRFSTLEITTVDPATLAIETLDLLPSYLSHLEQLSEYDALIDGLGTFVEAVETVKQVFHLGQLGTIESLNQLEDEMLGVMRALLRGKEAKDETAASLLLANVIPAHLARWRLIGIPKLFSACHRSPD